MNDLTRELVVQAAKDNHYLALQDGFRFRGKVEYLWELHIMGTYGWRVRELLLDILSRAFPERFLDDLGEIDYYSGIDEIASRWTWRVLKKFIAKHPELELHYDWGDLPKRTVKPQMRLF